MRNQINKLTLSVAAICVAAVNIGQAQDKALLDLLVSKGAITSQEAAALAKQSVAVTTATPATKKLTISGRFQTQYMYSDTKNESPAETPGKATNGFMVRRAIVSFGADVGDTWGLLGSFDFAKNSSTNNAQYFLDVFVSKKLDYDYLSGKADFGFKLTYFLQEEIISSGKLFTIERSVATRYFSSIQSPTNGSLGFGARYTGAYFSGKVKQVEGLTYGLAVTNSQNETISPGATYSGTGFSGVKGDDSVNAWANVGYEKKFGDINVSGGVNMGYGPGALAVSNNQYGEIIGLEPYLAVEIGKDFSLWADYILAQTQYGKQVGGNYEDATPMGFNVCGEYRFDLGEYGKLGLAARYAAIYTDGRGTSVSTGLYNAQNVTVGSNTARYNDAQSVYLGLNWYLIGNSLKVQAGYEWAQFTGAINTTSSMADANIIRLQMQVMF